MYYSQFALLLLLIIKTMGRFLLIALFLCFAFVSALYAGEYSAKRNAAKITFLSWFSGSSKVSYERAIFGNQTMETTLGYIGAGYDKYKNNPEGFTARYAHKFFVLDNALPLKGIYLRPEMIYSRFRYDAKDISERKLSEMGSLVFTVGYQYVINRFVIDAYFGSGYAWGAECDTHYQHGFSLWEYFGSYNKNIAMTFGVKLGVCF